MSTEQKQSSKLNNNKEKLIIVLLLGLILPLNFPFWGFKKEASIEVIKHFTMDKEADLITIEKWFTILNLIFCIPIIFICSFVCPVKLLLTANLVAFLNETIVYFYTIQKKSILFLYVYVIMVGFLNSLFRIFINIILSSLFAKVNHKHTSDSVNKDKDNKNKVKRKNSNLNLFFSVINSMQKGYIMLTSFLIPKLARKQSGITPKHNILEKFYPYFYYMSIIPTIASFGIYIITLRLKTKGKNTKYYRKITDEKTVKKIKLAKELRSSIVESFYLTLKEYEWYISGTTFTLLYLAINHRKNRYFVYGLELADYSIENSVDNVFMFIAPVIIYYMYKIYKNNLIYMLSQGIISMIGMIFLTIPLIAGFKSRVYNIFSLSVVGFAHILLTNTFYPMFIEIYSGKYVGTAFSVFNLFFSLMYLLLNFVIELIFKMENIKYRNSKEVIILFLVFILLCFAISTVLLTIGILKRTFKIRKENEDKKL